MNKSDKINLEEAYIKIFLKEDDDILLRRVAKTSPLEDADDLMSTARAFDAQNGDLTELDIVSGEKKDIAEKIAKLLKAFMGIICQDKKIINYTGKSRIKKN